MKYQELLQLVRGVVLLVDATQGIQAQTVAHFQAAKKEGLVMIPVINVGNNGKITNYTLIHQVIVLDFESVCKNEVRLLNQFSSILSKKCSILFTKVSSVELVRQHR